MTCPANPPSPPGFTVWKGPVPTQLTQWAMGLRDHIAPFPYGQTWSMPYNGATVIARKDHHQWTYRGGQIVTGICIPGITLYSQIPGGAGAMQNAGDPLANPDGTEAVYGADDVPAIQTTDWPVVVACGAVLVTLVGAFWYWIKR